jgi:hypothetical protein
LKRGAALPDIARARHAALTVPMRRMVAATIGSWRLPSASAAL